MFLPKIYPITDAGLTRLLHAEQVKKLIKGGAEFIQLREKHASPIDFFESAQEALEIARKHNVKIIINDRIDIALTLKADGVHLGQDDLPPEKARKILGKRAIIGFSTHNLEQALEAVKKPIDYIAVGPVFATTTKENPDKIVRIEGLKQIRKEIGEFPIVAIGGINYENYQKVLDAGADSVAIISGILSDAKNITQNFRKLK
ncbi:MAG: thiamine phosphate synthase [Aridibacter sp.]